MTPTDEQKKWLRRLAIVGIILGMICEMLPERYRTVCKTIANACSGGLL